MIKGKVTVQRHHMRSGKMSREGKEIHIRAGRKMGMHNVKIMALDIFYRFTEMVIGLEMPLPWDTGTYERTGKNEMSRADVLASPGANNVTSCPCATCSS